jgi:hypothetical protein
MECEWRPPGGPDAEQADLPGGDGLPGKGLSPARQRETTRQVQQHAAPGAMRAGGRRAFSDNHEERRHAGPNGAAATGNAGEPRQPLPLFRSPQSRRRLAEKPAHHAPRLQPPPLALTRGGADRAREVPPRRRGSDCGLTDGRQRPRTTCGGTSPRCGPGSPGWAHSLAIIVSPSSIDIYRYLSTCLSGRRRREADGAGRIEDIFMDNPCFSTSSQ